MSPVQILQRFYEAEAKFMDAPPESGQAEFAEMRETLDSDVVLHQSPDLPFGGEFRGHDGYERWASAMRTIFDQLEVSEQEFFERDDTVVVVCRFRTRSRVNGSIKDYPMVQVVRVKDEKIIDFRPFYWSVPSYISAAV